MAAPFDPYHMWLGIPPAEQPPHYYRLLGITLFEENADVIQTAADQRMMVLRTFQTGPHSPDSQRLLNEVSAARVCLLRPEKKAQYDAQLRAALEDRSTSTSNALSALADIVAAQTGPVASSTRGRPKKSAWQMPVFLAVGVVVVLGVLLFAASRSKPQPDAAKRPVPPPPTVAKVAKNDAPKIAVPDRPAPLPPVPPTPTKNDSPPAPVPPPRPVEPPKPVAAPTPTAPPIDPSRVQTNSIGMKLVAIPAGEFLMGSSDEEIQRLMAEATAMGKSCPEWYVKATPLEGPQHRVRITRSFWMGMREVTQAQYERVIGRNPSSYAASGARAESVAGQSTGNLPVESITWDEAVEFCQRLSELQEEKAAQRVYRLPTEAEWEYSCRAGTSSRYHFGDDEKQLGRYAWFCHSSGNLPHEVGLKLPNAWGLYDMHGNVWEWCADQVSTEGYAPGDQVDPEGPNEGENRVARGGFACDAYPLCRSAFRTRFRAGRSVAYVGFRVACDIGGQPRAAKREKPVEAAPPVVKKLPVPTAEKLAEAEKLVRDTFRDELGKASDPATARTLAKKLREQAAKLTDDPAGRLAMFRVAGRVASQAGDENTALAVIDDAAAAFEIDAPAAKFEVLAEAAKRPRSASARKPLAEKALGLADDALAADNLALAGSILKFVQGEMVKIRDKEVVQALRDRQKQLDAAQKAFAQIEGVLATLKDKPDDPEANLAAGRFYCLVKDDWARGLSHLAKASDSAWKTLAQQELASLSSSNPQSPIPNPLQFGDSWWDLSQTLSGREKEAAQVHAGRWYASAWLTASPGLAQSKIAKRLDEIGKLGLASRIEAGARSLTNSLGMKLVLIPAGEFDMGATQEEIEGRFRQAGSASTPNEWLIQQLRAESPQHHVRITRTFYFDTYPVTQGLFQRLMGTNPSIAGTAGKPLRAGVDRERLPVESVTWDEAVDFCRRLSSLPGEKAFRRRYRLPTEAEWEYAARAGTKGIYYFGDDPRVLADYAWFLGNASGPQPVGMKRPNAWGLYDILGNVGEWCLDYHSSTYYATSSPVDPQGPASGSRRVARGLGYQAIACTCTFREGITPTVRNGGVGFRVVCERY